MFSPPFLLYLVQAVPLLRWGRKINFQMFSPPFSSFQTPPSPTKSASNTSETDVQLHHRHDRHGRLQAREEVQLQRPLCVGRLCLLGHPFGVRPMTIYFALVPLHHHVGCLGWTVSYSWSPYGGDGDGGGGLRWWRCLFWSVAFCCCCCLLLLNSHCRDDHRKSLRMKVTRNLLERSRPHSNGSGAWWCSSEMDGGSGFDFFCLDRRFLLFHFEVLLLQ